MRANTRTRKEDGAAAGAPATWNPSIYPFNVIVIRLSSCTRQYIQETLAPIQCGALHLQENLIAI